MKIFIVLFAIVAAASAISFFDVVKEEWHSFKVNICFFFNLKLFMMKLFDISK